MVVSSFPPVSFADQSGLLAIGGDLEVESLLLAYRSGIFPWPVFERGEITWFAPPERAVLRLNKLHVPRSLRKARERTALKFRFNTAVRGVIENCATSANRGAGEGTWITQEIVNAYSQLHQAGFCHSVECFSEDELVGGLYGVAIAGMFAGESLFYKRANASKLCLWALIEYLREKNIEWIDCQQMTPLAETFGAELVSREIFLELLDEALSKDVKLFEVGEQPMFP